MVSLSNHERKHWLKIITNQVELLLSHLRRLGVDSDRFSPLIEFAAYAVQFRYTEIDLDDAPLDRPETIRKITELFEHVQTLMASQVASQTETT